MTDYTMEDLLPEEQEHLDSLDEMATQGFEELPQDDDMPEWMKESDSQPLEEEPLTADYDDVPPDDEPVEDESETSETACEETDADEEASEEPPSSDITLDVDDDTPTGERLSLRGDEFDPIIDRADEVLNRLISKLYAKGQTDGEMTLKILFERHEDCFEFSGTVGGKINDTIKPQKIAGQLMDIQFDIYGNALLPADREQQLTFETAETVSATVTTDASGVVESVELDGEDTDPVNESVDNENESPDIENEEPAEVTVEVMEETLGDEAI